MQLFGIIYLIKQSHKRTLEFFNSVRKLDSFIIIIVVKAAYPKVEHLPERSFSQVDLGLAHKH